MVRYNSFFLNFLLISLIACNGEVNLDELSSAEARSVINPYSIDLKNSTLQYENCDSMTNHFPNSLDGLLNDNGQSYAIYLQPEQCENEEAELSGSPFYKLPWRTGSQSTSLGHALAFDVKSVNPDHLSKLRTEVAIINHNDPNPIQIGDTIFFKFNLYIHHHSQPTQHPGNYYTTISQFWQCLGGGSIGYSPPFTVRIKRDPNDSTSLYTLQFVIRNVNYNNNAGFVIYEYTVSDDEWNTFVLNIKPHYTTDQAFVKIWTAPNNFDCQLNPDVSWVGELGYDPTPPAYDGTCDGFFDMRVGVYKNRQSRRTKVFFDDVVLARDCESMIAEEAALPQ